MTVWTLAMSDRATRHRCAPFRDMISFPDWILTRTALCLESPYGQPDGYGRTEPIPTITLAAYLHFRWILACITRGFCVARLPCFSNGGTEICGERRARSVCRRHIAGRIAAPTVRECNPKSLQWYGQLAAAAENSQTKRPSMAAGPMIPVLARPHRHGRRP